MRTGNWKEAQVQANGAVRRVEYHAVADGKLPNSKRPDGSDSGLLVGLYAQTPSLQQWPANRRSGEASRSCRLQAGGNCSRDKAVGLRLRRL